MAASAAKTKAMMRQTTSKPKNRSAETADPSAPFKKSAFETKQAPASEREAFKGQTLTPNIAERTAKLEAAQTTKGASRTAVAVSKVGVPHGGSKAPRLSTVGTKVKPPAVATAEYTIAKTREFISNSPVTRGGEPPSVSEVFPGFTFLERRELAVLLLDAISVAVDRWTDEAYFDDLAIFAVHANGQPGCLNGPALDPAIRAALPASLTGQKEVMAKSVAEAFSDSFALWQANVTVPGLPWYPAFAFWPGPEADPMPNVPSPLGACVSQYVTKMVVPFELEGAISSAVPAVMREERVLIRSLAGSLSRAFAVWRSHATVQNVIGFGPVPAWAPPFVPAHSVSEGSVVPEPPHIYASPFRSRLFSM